MSLRLICSIRFAEVGQTASLQQCVDWFWKRALLSECRLRWDQLQTWDRSAGYGIKLYPI